MRYRITRHYIGGRKRVIKRGLTLQEAQAHCSRPGTREPGKWFDGYTQEV